MAHSSNASGKSNTQRIGILLAAGYNTRLYPTTLCSPKSLLPVYDKPLIYYSLSLLMLAKTQRVIIITTPEGRTAHERLLGDGSDWGMEIRYRVQDKARGIADAFLLCADDVRGKPSILALGDNIYYSNGMTKMLGEANCLDGATVFAHTVHDPERFGVIEIDKNGMAIDIEEKPTNPKSSLAVTGCYFYDAHALTYAEQLKPSPRGELEITDLNREYLRRGNLHVKILGRGSAWFDTGTPDSLAEACYFVQAAQKQQTLMIASPEEVAWRNNWIDSQQLLACAQKLGKTAYGIYLQNLVDKPHLLGISG